MAKKTLKEKLVESRIIVVNGYIDSEKASEIILKLLTFNKENEKEEIQMYFSAHDGAYLDAMAIYDTMKSLSNDISGTCIGAVGGYSALLLAGCTKGKRYILPHSTVYIEQPYGYLQAGVNQQTVIAIEAEEIRKEREVFESVLSEVTGQTVERIHADCEKGIDLDAKEALSYGIVDVIID